jgi:peptidoglycan/LPS O-acetylase OafA/YrhL
MTKATPKRIPELDGIRACAILMVFLRHVYNVQMLWMGVDVFFVLSGFLITGILIDTPRVSFGNFLSRFYSRRVRRILPPYVLVLLVVSLVYDWHWLRNWYLYIGMTNFLFMLNAAPDGAVVGHFWSLAVEEQFYLVWPVLVYFVRPKLLPRWLVGAIIVAPILRAVGMAWMDSRHYGMAAAAVYQLTPFRMDCLATGGLLTFLWRAHREKFTRWGHLGLYAALGLTVLTFVIHRFDPHFSVKSLNAQNSVWLFELTLGISTGLMVWALSGRYTAVLRSGVMRWLGRISYTLYLVHLLAKVFAERWVGSIGKGLLVGPVTFLLAAGFSELSWRLLEQPLLHGGNRRQAARELAAAEPSHGRSEAQQALQTLD